MKKLVILLDLDDILNNQNQVWTKYLNDTYDYNVDYNDITEWDISKSYPGLDSRSIYGPVLSPMLVPLMSAPMDAQEYTYSWYSAGHILLVTTSTSTQNIKEKTQWLYENYKWFNEDHLMLTRKKQLIRGDVLIDDGIHNLLPDSETQIVPTYEKLCFDKPWNRGFSCLEHGIHRAHSFSEIDEVIKILEKRNGD